MPFIYQLIEPVLNISLPHSIQAVHLILILVWKSIVFVMEEPQWSRLLDAT